jgi:hypothetical protein
MRTMSALVLSLLVVACGSGSAGTAASFDDPEVARIHERMMEVISPNGGWERARYLEFDWAVGDNVRRHRWDRWEGDARVESVADGQTLVALFNTSDPTAGRVWLGGVELSGEEAETRLNAAYRSHINDGYWLLMPFKWSDPGVHTEYLGEQVDEAGRRWEVVQLSFDEVGLTPQNRYHAFVNPETGRMERWHHFSNVQADPSPSDWWEWGRVGPIELAVNRGTAGEVRIHFPHLRVETSVPAGVFDPPAD